MQYEIARLVSNEHLKYEDIQVWQLEKFPETNEAAAPLTGSVLLNRIDATDEGDILTNLFVKSPC